jgi:CHAT domain-containing protein
VLVSLWPVDDEVTCLLMDRVHRLLAAGTPPADALAAAQRHVRALDGAARDAAYEQLCAAHDVPAAAGGGRRSASKSSGRRTERDWAAFVVIGS